MNGKGQLLGSRIKGDSARAIVRLCFGVRARLFNLLGFDDRVARLLSTNIQLGLISSDFLINRATIRSDLRCTCCYHSTTMGVNQML